MQETKETTAGADTRLASKSYVAIAMAETLVPWDLCRSD